MAYLIEQYHIDAIVNFAAESHVDRSILHPEIFVETNVQGTLALLHEAYRRSILSSYRSQQMRFMVH